MRSILFTTLLFIFPLLITAQSISELEEKLQNTSTNEKKVEILHSLIDATLQSSPGKSEQYAKQAISIAEQTNPFQQTLSYGYLGKAYRAQKKYTDAITNFKTALSLDKEHNNGSNQGYYNAEVGNTYQTNKQYSQAITYLTDAYNSFSKKKNYANMAYAGSNIADMYISQNKEKLALEWLEKIVPIHKKNNDKQSETTTLLSIGSIHANRGDNKNALRFLNKSLDKAKLYHQSSLQSDIESAIQLVNDNVSSITNSKTDFEREQEKRTQQQIVELRSSTDKSLAEIEKLSEENQIKELKLMVQKQNLEKEIENERVEKEEKAKLLELEKSRSEKIEAEKAVSELANAKKSQQLLFLAIGFILVLLMGVLIFSGYLRKKKANDILQEKNDKIEAQKLEIEKKNRNITQSIDYAEKIQKAVIPVPTTILNYFSDAFILFQPKDVVSGDFYWLYHNKDCTYVAAVDCTGHGVPGAFMSIIGSNLLDAIIIEHHDKKPSEILTLLSKGLTQKLKQGSDGRSVKDGMDMAFAVINHKTNTLLFSGARNPLYHIRDKELSVLKANKLSVGYNSASGDSNFTTEEMEIKKGDQIYLFSDGYVDQKGGPDNKKFYMKPFRDLLTANSDKNLKEQKQELLNSIQKWKGDNEQLDDMLIIGLKI